MPIIKWTTELVPGGRGKRRRVWTPTAAIAPGPVTVLQQWLADPEVDVVMAGHSKGANIAMSILNRGFG